MYSFVYLFQDLEVFITREYMYVTSQRGLAFCCIISDTISVRPHSCHTVESGICSQGYLLHFQESAKVFLWEIHLAVQDPFS